MKWFALCNGGPNDTTVASIGQIQKVESQRTLEQGCFVETEKEAGRMEEAEPMYEGD
jgi:hypothetical protein